MVSAFARAGCLAFFFCVVPGCGPADGEPLEEDRAVEDEVDPDLGTVEAALALSNQPAAPANLQRNFTCPVSFASARVTTKSGAVHTYRPASAAPSTRWGALSPVLDSLVPPSQFNVTLIDIRRVNGVPHYDYMSNGTQRVLFQPWSSSKFMSFATMASKLRLDSAGRVGISGHTPDRANGGIVTLGDLVTFATTYRVRYPPYNSNNIGSWTKDVQSRPYAHEMVTQWMGRTRESFGGGYGQYNSRLGGQFVGFNGERYTARLSDAEATPNRLSTYTIAEFLKRMVMHRENPELAVPHTTWSDIKTILYGTDMKKSRYFKDRVGGMLGGMGSYAHRAIGMWPQDTLNATTGGQWRVFSKVGWGPGSDCGNDFLWHAYVCAPHFDAQGNPTEKGREFIVATRLKRQASRCDPAADELMVQATGRIIRALRNGTLGQ